MTALWCDSFEDYQTLTQRYDTVSLVGWSSGSGRYGTNGIHFSTGSGANTGTLAKIVTSSTTLVSGIAYHGTSIPVSSDLLIGYYSGSVLKLGAYLNSDWSISFNLGGSPSINKITPFNWYYIEVKAVFNQTANSQGTFEVRVGIDGRAPTTWLNLTYTTVDPLLSANKVVIGSVGEPYLDDYYILNGTGAYNNDFLGDVRVVNTLPITDGTYTQWTPSTGSIHYSLVNEVPPDTSTYVKSTVASLTDTYSMTRLDTYLRDCDFIQLNTYVQTTSGQFTPTVYTSGSRYFGTAQSAVGGASYSYQMWERRPDLNNAWTGTSLNNAEMGIST